MPHRRLPVPSSRSSRSRLHVRLGVVAFAVGLVASSLTACSGGAVTSGIAGRTPTVHRASADACSTAKAPDTSSDAGIAGACHSNADCTMGRNGRCVTGGRVPNQCVYDACYSDSECASSDGTGVCACGGGFGGNNVCLTSGCRVDGDCGAGGFCSPTLGSCGHVETAQAYYCHTAQDECVDDQDCATDAAPRGYCAYEKTIGHWKCSTSECAG